MKKQQEFLMLHVENKNFFTLFILFMLWMPLTAGFAASGEGIFNVKDFGARGDGVHLETAAIQKTIDACAKTGGTVLLPPGKYLSGTLFLKSHVTLHLSNGAILLGSTNIQDYPETRPDVEFYGKSWVTQSLIYGENLEDVAITGNGTIDGQGSAFKVTTKKKPDRYRNRPYVFWFVKCRNVRVESVNLQNSAKWMQHYQMCDEVTIRGINVYNHANQNNDMMDIDGCHNVVISDCFGDTDDDALTLKSLSGRACENIAITNCVLSSHCNALKMGTESHAGFKNISISNIVIKPSQSEKMIYGSRQGTSGISLEVVDGGVMDGVTISNVRIDGPQVPLFIRLGNRGRIYKEGMAKPAVGVLRNINISNIVASAGDSIGCSITGLPGHPVENVSLSHIRMIFPGGVGSEAAMKAVPEKEDAYPEGTMFGDLPA
ncbi:MAG: glycoside hydrolase family 28 protein, partial [Calditrichia bacterium]